MSESPSLTPSSSVTDSQTPKEKILGLDCKIKKLEDENTNLKNRQWAWASFINNQTIPVVLWGIVVLGILCAFYHSFKEISSISCVAKMSVLNDDVNNHDKNAEAKAENTASQNSGNGAGISSTTNITAVDGTKVEHKTSNDTKSTTSDLNEKMTALKYINTLFVLTLAALVLIPLWCTFRYREYN